MRKVSVVLLLLCSGALFSETLDNGILLKVTKTSPAIYHLEWRDTERSECWPLYQVWASKDPVTLGHLVATVRADHLDLLESEPPTLWYFQIRRPGDPH